MVRGVNEVPDKVDKVLISTKKLINLGYLLAIINPIFGGLIFGLVIKNEPGMEKDGRLIFILSLVWGLILWIFTSKYLNI